MGLLEGDSDGGGNVEAVTDEGSSDSGVGSLTSGFEGEARRFCSAKRSFRIAASVSVVNGSDEVFFSATATRSGELDTATSAGPFNEGVEFALGGDAQRRSNSMLII